MTKQRQGITLVALVITIIILLILAGISMNWILGKDGIIQKAKMARIQTERVTAKERIELEVISSYSEDKGLLASNIIKNIKKNIPEANIKNENFKLEVELNGYLFTIDENGKVEYLRPSINIKSITVTKEDGKPIPEDGVEEGTKLKIEFEVSLDRGNILKIEPGIIQNGKVTYTTQGTEKEIEFNMELQLDGNTYQENKTILLDDYYKKLWIGKTVKRGDYVNYTLGNWTNEDIEKIGNLYYGTNDPHTECNLFGGFGVGKNKDCSLDPKGTTGWRVLNINSDGTVNIIHAGTPEKFNYNPFIIQGDIEELLSTRRDWSMYEDCSTNSVNTNFAVQGSGRCVSKQELLPLGSWDTLTNMGVNYYVVGADSKNTGVNGTNGGDTFLGLAYLNYIRPVVTLKAEIKVRANEGETTHTTIETAWNLEV